MEETVVEESVPEMAEIVSEQPAVEAEPEATEPAPDVRPDDPKGVVKRINKLTAKNYQAQARAEKAEARIKELEAQIQAKPAPKLEDFDYDDDKFLEAKIAHTVDQRTAALQETYAERQAKEEKARVEAEFAARVAESGIEDYSEVVGELANTVPLPLDVLDVIQTDQQGPELAYYLGKNLDEAAEIAQMPPVLAARELGRISAKLSSTASRKVSKTPEPVAPVTSSGPSTSNDYEKLDMNSIMDLDF